MMHKAKTNNYLNIRQICLKGLILGLIIGSIFGLWESILVILKGYYIPINFPFFVYSVDLLLGAIFGIFFSLIFRIIFCYKTYWIEKIYKYNYNYFYKVILFIFISLVIITIIWSKVQPQFPINNDAKKQINTIKNNKNIILISIDTLRADHLSCYGYPLRISPNIDKFSKESTMFKFAISQSPWTLPSHTSLMTSLYPSQHGANRGSTHLIKECLTLAEILEKESFITAGFTDGGYVSSNYGFDQGFYIYDDGARKKLNLVYKPVPYRLALKSPFSFFRKMSFSFSVSKIIDWLRLNANNNFFLFIHTFEVHDYFYNHIKLKPYLNKLGIKYKPSMNKIIKGKCTIGNNIINWILNANEREIDYVRALYDAEIMYVDELLNNIFSELKSLKLDSNTLVILTSDHGEGFNKELKRIHHGGRLHNDQINVPLIFRLPKVIPANKLVNTPVQLIDVLPTILDLLNIPIPKQVQGNSLSKLICNDNFEQNYPVYSEELYHRFNEKNLRENIKEGEYRMVSLIYDGIKIIHSSDGNELYDLQKDLEERNNLFHDKEYLAKSANLQEKLKFFIYNYKPKYLIQKNVNYISHDIREQLKSLGYLH